MRVLPLVLALLTAAPAVAQTLQTQAPQVIDILGNADLVGPITLTPATPGDELLYRSRVWRHVVFVAVLHPTKSGPLGAYPWGGVCIESSLVFAATDVAITIADVDGDGLGDAIGTSPSLGTTQVLKGLGRVACR